MSKFCKKDTSRLGNPIYPSLLVREKRLQNTGLEKDIITPDSESAPHTF